MEETRYVVYMETWEANSLYYCTPRTSAGLPDHIIGFEEDSEYHSLGERHPDCTVRQLFIWTDYKDYNLGRLKMAIGNYAPRDESEAYAIEKYLMKH